MNILKFVEGAFEEDARGKKLMIGCLRKTAWKSLCTVLCSSVFVTVASAQTMIENFEYGSDAALLAAWTPQSATLTISSSHSIKSTGTNSMRVERTFAANAGETEILAGPMLATPLVIGTNQYLTLRISGNPQFTNGSSRTFYLYAFDGNGNFGRWSATIPTITNWQLLNFVANAIERPAESSALPDFSNITQFKFYLVGQGDPAGTAYSATIYLDDLRMLPAPRLSIVQAPSQRVLMNNLIPGTSYTLQQTTNLTRPVTVTYTFSANSTSQTWPIPKGQQAFYKLYFAP